MVLLPQGPIYTGHFFKKRDYLNSSISTALWARGIQSCHSHSFSFSCASALCTGIPALSSSDKNAIWTDSFLPPQGLGAPAGQVQIVSYTWHRVPLCVRGARKGTTLPCLSIQKSKQPFPYLQRWIIISVALSFQ